MHKKINSITINNIIERHQKPENNTYSAKFQSYGYDKYYAAFIETKNKTYLFVRDIFDDDKYRCLKVYEK